nr:MAG TPA: hypothetical protein [Caudoviricetes sp.]
MHKNRHSSDFLLCHLCLKNVNKKWRTDYNTRS